VLSITVIPEILRVALAPTATVQELEDEIRRRHNVSVPLEFVVTDDGSTSVLDRLDRTRQMGSIDLLNRLLVAQEEGTAESQESDGIAPAHDVSTSQWSRLDPMQVTCGTSSSQATVSYKFVVAEDNEEFTLEFAPGQTVLDAKKKIKAKFQLDGSDEVTLLFSGKTLRDAFVLDRLRIGAQTVVVHLRETRRLLIFSVVDRRER
jgi:hypothetical protein